LHGCGKMRRDLLRDQIACFVCDYGLIFLAILSVAAVAAWRYGSGIPTAPEPLPATPPPISTSSFSTATFDVVETSTAPASTKIPTAVPAQPSKPEFILVFVPVAWQSGLDRFNELAQLQADMFISESRIDDYFTVRVEFLDVGPDNVSLADQYLDSTVLEFGLAHMPGDRYIGLTDGDLSLEGDSSIAGWTTGLSGQSVVAEANGISITAHELGHTFGLCDEYNYAAWDSENQETSSGCPNPYPSTCPKTIEGGVICLGTPTSDGRNSIMGSAGDDSYGFNDSCLDH
jgi:hypothetical protein